MYFSSFLALATCPLSLYVTVQGVFSASTAVTARPQLVTPPLQQYGAL